MESKINNPLQNVKIWRYWVLLRRPALIGILGSFVWYLLHTKISIVPEDQGVFEPLLGIIGIAHSLIASMQIQKVNDQHQKIEESMRLKNKAMFEEYAYTRISPVIKLLLAVFSVIFFLIFILYPFASVYAGLIVVWTTMFVLYLLWEVAIELDDPFNGVSIITKEDVEILFNPKKQV